MPSSEFWEKVRPWECAACHTKNISANKSECPSCQQPRAGSAEASAQEASGQATRGYEGEKALHAGIAAMAKQGWRVVSQSSHQPSAGVGRALTLGLGALVLKPKMHFTVIFERIPLPES